MSSSSLTESERRSLRLSRWALLVALVAAVGTLAQAAFTIPAVQSKLPIPWEAKGTITKPGRDAELTTRNNEITGTIKRLPESYSLIFVVLPTDDTSYYPEKPFRPTTSEWSLKKVSFGGKDIEHKNGDNFVITLYSASPDASLTLTRLLDASETGGLKSLPATGLTLLDQQNVSRVK